MPYRAPAHRSTLAGAVLLGALCLFGVTGCAGPAGADPDPGDGSGAVVVLGLDTMRYNPEAVTVKAGEPVRIVFRNAGVITHDFITEGADRNVKLAGVTGGRGASGLFQANKPGTYAVVCVQPGHKEAGMVGKVIVE